LHWKTQAPFQVQQQLQAPPCNILQRFCSAPQATSSSHLQVIFRPPAHFSNVAVQRGRIRTLPGACVPAGEVQTVLFVAAVRSNIIVDIERNSFGDVRASREHRAHVRREFRLRVATPGMFAWQTFYLPARRGRLDRDMSLPIWFPIVGPCPATRIGLGREPGMVAHVACETQSVEGRTIPASLGPQSVLPARRRRDADDDSRGHAALGDGTPFPYRSELPKVLRISGNTLIAEEKMLPLSGRQLQDVRRFYQSGSKLTTAKS
jgi:hypothetical protein